MAPQRAASVGPPARRRSPEVRQALLDAASTVFSRKGFAGASTKEIAKAALTSETVIYRHFASKEELFNAAVLQPFIEVLEDYERSFKELLTQPWEDRALLETLIASLYDRLVERREAILAMVAASGDPAATEASHEGVERLNDFFESLRRLSVERWNRGGGGYSVERIPLVLRLIVGMVVSVTVLEPWFVPNGWNRPKRNELISTMTDLILHGFMEEEITLEGRVRRRPQQR